VSQDDSGNGAIKKLRELADELDKARESQRAAASQLNHAARVTKKVQTAVTTVTQARRHARQKRSSS